jgi:hypothetical protein
MWPGSPTATTSPPRGDGDRQRPLGRLVRGPDPSPAVAVAGREPQDEPSPAHRRHRADPPRHRPPDWAGPTTAAGSPSPRPRWRHCAASSGDSATSSAGSWSPTHKPLRCRPPPRSRRAREGTRGRLHNPARPTCPPRSSALRTSHFPDPRTRRYPQRRPFRTPHAASTASLRADAPEPSRCSAPPDERP